MKTPIEKTIRFITNNNVNTKINIFSSKDKENSKYYSLTNLIGKTALVEYEYLFEYTGNTYSKSTVSPVAISESLTTEEEIRDYILNELKNN